MSQSILAIGDFSVRQLDGLFSLNDLHAAAGGEVKHQPTRFMRLDQTQSLIAEIQSPEMVNGAVKVIKGSVNPGTYACRELVIAYAAWISAAFHLKVIRVFLAQQAAALPSSTITPAQKQHLHELVDLIAAAGRQSHAETWARLHRKFHVNKYELLRQDQFDAACAYLRGKMDGQDIGALVQKHFPDALRLEAPEPAIDPVQLLTTGQAEPLDNLTSTQRTIIAQRAFELANEAYGLIHTHLERRVAFKVRPGEVTDYEVRSITQRTTLGNSLAHTYLLQISTLTNTVNWMQATVAQAANMLRDDMARFGQA